jgi:hypothetical protein
VLGFRDHERRPDAHDARRLAQDHLDAARILVPGDLSCAFRGFDVCETNDAPFGLRDDLLCDDDNVAVLEVDRLADQLGQVVALPYLGKAGDRDDANVVAQGIPVRRIPACAL